MGGVVKGDYEPGHGIHCLDRYDERVMLAEECVHDPALLDEILEYNRGGRGSANGPMPVQ